MSLLGGGRSLHGETTPPTPLTLHLDTAQTRSVVSTTTPEGYRISGTVGGGRKVGPLNCIFDWLFASFWLDFVEEENGANGLVWRKR